MQFRAKMLQQGLFFLKMSMKVILYKSLHFDRHFPRQRWSVPDVTREMTIFFNLKFDSRILWICIRHIWKINLFWLIYRLTTTLSINTIKLQITCSAFNSKKEGKISGWDRGRYVRHGPWPMRWPPVAKLKKFIYAWINSFKKSIYFFFVLLNK